MCADTYRGDDAAITPADTASFEAAEPENAKKMLMTAAGSIETPALEVSLSAIASAKTESLSATGSAIGIASTGGDVNLQLSALGLAAAKGSGSMRQSYASAFVASEQLALSQSAVPLGIARTITFEQSGALVSASAETTVRRGFIGILLSGRTDVAEDSKVLLDTRGALILAAALLGGFGLVAAAMFFGARRLSQWRPSISMPSMRDFPSLKELPKIAERFRH